MTTPGFQIEHPGIVFWEEYLQPLGISQSRFARDVHISYSRANEILNGKRAITPDTALRISRYLGTSAEYWLNWQSTYDLQNIERKMSVEYDAITRVA